MLVRYPLSETITEQRTDYTWLFTTECRVFRSEKTFKITTDITLFFRILLNFDLVPNSEQKNLIQIT